MKLRRYAEHVGVRYETAWRWWKSGTIKGYQLSTGTIVITEGQEERAEQPKLVAVYARVSANEQKLKQRGIKVFDTHRELDHSCVVLL